MRPLTIATGIAFAILVALGCWQLERLAWKTTLLSQIDAAERQDAVPLAPGLPTFAKVRVSGRFQPTTGLYGSEGRGTILGARQLAILRPPTGPDIVVDRGWVPPDAKAIPPTGDVSVEGWMRPPARAGWFSAPDDPARKRFYTLDPDRIGATLGAKDVAPFVLIALGPQGIPDPGRSLPRPPNDHLSYALTWFGLAAGLIGVYLGYVRKARAG